MLLIVMREANQQGSAVGLECSSCVYKNLHVVLKSARDAMVFELQAMHPAALATQNSRHVCEPASKSCGRRVPQDDLHGQEQMQGVETQCDGVVAEAASRKRPAGSENRDSSKRPKLDFKLASQAEQ